MSNSNQVKSSGPTFFGWLLLLFIGLKLTGFIAWSWLWVLAPLWLPPAVGLLLMFFVFLLGIVMTIAE